MHDDQSEHDLRGTMDKPRQCTVGSVVPAEPHTIRYWTLNYQDAAGQFRTVEYLGLIP